jgi:hypothetical protein
VFLGRSGFRGVVGFIVVLGFGFGAVVMWLGVVVLRIGCFWRLVVLGDLRSLLRRVNLALAGLGRPLVAAEPMPSHK